LDLIVQDKATLTGNVTVSGAKNSATRVLAAALLSAEQVTLRNFPLELEDVKAKLSFISQMGAELQASADM
jgi:UDP-N-acetylglucosamine 1-carboxyvinyltransferase